MRGELIYDRVVEDPGTVLARGLDAGFSGYAVIEPAGTVLLDGEDRGVMTLRDGVPVAAHHEGSEAAGPAAVAALANRGPYRIALYAEPGVRADRGEHTIAPGVPAEVLAADPVLADRTARAAPEDTVAPTESPDALEAFLDNESKIEAIQEQARREAEHRAAEWGLADAVDAGAPDANR